MAKLSKVKAGEDLALRLAALGDKSEDVAKKAIRAGSGVIADEVRARLEAMPVERYRYLKEGETFAGLSQDQKKDLMDGFGITPVGQDKSGMWNAKVGFEGYGSHPTRKYPKGLPNPLLARSVESGSSVRQKRPFVRPAVSAKRKAAIAAMQQVIDDEIKKTMKG